MYEQGTIFKITCFLHEKGEYYILALIDYEHWSLISLKDGNRWHTPIKSSTSVNAISKEDFEKIISRHSITQVDKDEKEIVINNVIKDRKIEVIEVDKNIQELKKIKELLLKEEKE